MADVKPGLRLRQLNPMFSTNDKIDSRWRTVMKEAEDQNKWKTKWWVLIEGENEPVLNCFYQIMDDDHFEWNFST